MTAMRLARIGNAFLLFMYLCVSARACSCGAPSPICSVYFGMPSIFRGLPVEKVLEQPHVQMMHDEDGNAFQMLVHGRYRVTFAVNEQFRGETKSQVIVYTNEESIACGFDFQLGSEYVVFAGTNRAADQLSTSVCSMTHTVRDLAKDESVQWMRDLATALSGARIFGAVRLGRNETPPHATISVHGPVSLNVATDDAGKYDLKGLPPGEYKVAAIMPTGFAVDTEPRTAKLVDKACAEMGWDASYDAHVRGLVTEVGGKPVPKLVMQLQHRDARSPTDFDTSDFATTDADGRYNFSRVAPGEYFVLANSYAETPDVPYPKVYFPASATVENATTIQVKPSESLDDINVELPHAWKKINVVVKVVLDDGTPAVGVPVESTLVSDVFSAFPMTATTGAEGVATLPVYEGQEYYAIALSSSGRPQYCGGPVRFLAKAGTDLGVIRIEHPWDDCLAQLDSASIHPGALAQ